MSAVVDRPERALVIGCGALASEIGDVIARNSLDAIDVEYLPATLHNRPERIAAAVEERLRRAVTTHDHVFVAYADCGTGGELDRVLERYGVERLDGAHCYEFFAGPGRFAGLADEEPGTFYLTDFLAKHFDRLVWTGLGLDRHPELLTAYFGNYRRVVLLAQTDDPVVTRRAEAGAARLGLPLERIDVGYGSVEPALVTIASRKEVA